MKKKLLILDLDETLIHASEEQLEYQEDFCFKKYYVYKRPGLESFIKIVGQYYNLAVWTSSTEGYAKHMVETIFPEDTNLEFVYNRDQCHLEYIPEHNSFFFAKDLSKVADLGYRLSEVLVLDDSPGKFKSHRDNLVKAKTYNGEQEDDELSKLTEFLPRLAQLIDVRPFEKRNWRYKMMLENITAVELSKWQEKKKASKSSDCASA